jgi:preprotein translocase subunit YajC
MFESIVYAQTTVQDTTPKGPGGFSFPIMMVLLLVVMYFLMIRPQQKRQKQLNETLNSLKVGDQIITTSGFLATIDSVLDANTYIINLGGGVKVQILRSGIAGKQSHEPQISKK